MNNFKKVAVITLLSLISSTSFAQSLTATGSNLDEAEAKIAAQAKSLHANYRITEANFKNKMHVTAELTQ